MAKKSQTGCLSCSFCGKSQDRVARLIASGKNDSPAYICDECVAVCNSILKKDAAQGDSSRKTKGWVYRVKSWWNCGIIEDVIQHQ